MLGPKRKDISILTYVDNPMLSDERSYVDPMLDDVVGKRKLYISCFNTLNCMLT